MTWRATALAILSDNAVVWVAMIRIESFSLVLLSVSATVCNAIARIFADRRTAVPPPTVTVSVANDFSLPFILAIDSLVAVVWVASALFLCCQSSAVSAITVVSLPVRILARRRAIVPPPTVIVSVASVLTLPFILTTVLGYVVMV